MSKLISFYKEEQTDDYGRFLSDILEENDYWLERTHNYIQWLFPNTEKSHALLNSPIVTAEFKNAFDKDITMRKNLKRCLDRMLDFYGIIYEGGSFHKGKNWNLRKESWIVGDTHNNLRITRILKCLTTLGFKSIAVEFQSFLLCLSNTESSFGISNSSISHWTEATNI